MIKWSSCRTVGNLQILKVSYAALVLAPFMGAFIPELREIGFSTCQILALYFSSLSLAVANVLYDIFCPSVIKRFASPNDLFRDMVSIKDVSSRVYPRTDKFEARYEHAKNGWRSANESRKFANWLVMILFLLASALFLYLIVARSIDLTFIALDKTPPNLCPIAPAQQD